MKKLFFLSLITLLSLTVQAQILEITQDTTKRASKEGRFREAYVNGVRYVKGANGNADILGTKMFRSLAELRRFTNPVPGVQYWVAEKGKRGYFEVEPADQSTVDDNLNTIVASGKRFKRVTDYSVDQLNIRQNQSQLVIQGQNSVLDALQSISIPATGKSWTIISSGLSGAGANGGSVNTSARSISVASNQTGNGSYLEQTFSMASYPDWKIGDRVTLRLLVSESTENLIQPNLMIECTIDGQTIPVTYQSAVVQSATTLALTFDYTVTSLSGQVKVRLKLNESSPVLASGGVYTWSSLSFYNNVSQMKAFANQVAAVTQGVPLIQTTTYKGMVFPEWYHAVGDGVADDTQALQAAINAAMAGSKMLFLPSGVYNVTGQLVINGPLTIVGVGETSVIRWVSYGNLFVLKTTAPFEFSNFKVSTDRPDGTSLMDMTQVPGINKYSTLRGMVIDDFYNGLFLNNCQHFTIEKSRFSCKYSSINIENNAATQNVKNLIIRQNEFVGNASHCLFARYISNVEFSENRLPVVNGTHNAKSIAIELSDKVKSEGLVISRNRFESHYYNAIFINATAAGAELKNVHIEGNTASNMTMDYFSTVFFCTGTLEAVHVRGNTIRNNRAGMFFKGIKNLFITDNMLNAQDGNEGSVGLYLEDNTGKIYEYGNAFDYQSTANVFTNSPKSSL